MSIGALSDGAELMFVMFSSNQQFDRRQCSDRRSIAKAMRGVREGTSVSAVEWKDPSRRPIGYARNRVRDAPANPAHPLWTVGVASVPFARASHRIFLMYVRGLKSHAAREKFICLPTLEAIDH